MARYTLLLQIFLTLVYGQMSIAAQPSKSESLVQVTTERVGGMTHLEFSGRNEWVYDLEKKDGLLEVTLPTLTAQGVETLQNFTSLFIKKIVVEAAAQNKSKITIQLSDPKIENFDYLTQNPSRLILDIFSGDAKLTQELEYKHQLTVMANKKSSENKEKQKNTTVASGNKPSIDRRPAFAEFLSVAPDVNSSTQGDSSLKGVDKNDDLIHLTSLISATDDDMEAKVIEADGNIYLRFPILKLNNKHLQELQSFQPEYVIKKSYSDENKQARALLELFKKRSYASFLAAKKIFKQDFPVSSYDEIFNYVEADTWIELWKNTKEEHYLRKAMNLYRMLLERNPNTTISERTLIQAALLSYEVDEFFLATKLLKRYLKEYPDTPFTNPIKIYLANSLAYLNNFEGAKGILEQVIQSEDPVASVEAEYRMGDIFFLKQQYRRAERSYLKAIEKYPSDLEKYPNALFNTAEAQFNLAEYNSSLETYSKFYKTYPNHSFSGYALTRIGELVDIIFKDKKRSQGFYNESFYRFRNTTGGTIARMRSLSQRFKDMKEKELLAAVDEIKEREKAINLHQVDEFSAFMISDGYYNRGEFLKSANALISYFQINPQPINIKKFEKRISRAIAGEVRDLIKKNDLIPALALIEKHQKSWLSKSRRVDVQFFRAQTYEGMNLLAEALDSYKQLQQRLEQIVGTKEEKERKIFEYYPSFDQIHVRLASVYERQGQLSEAFANLKKVKNISNLDPHSKSDYHMTLSAVSFANKQYPEALATAELVNQDEIIDTNRREKFNIYLSDLYEKNQKFDKAIAILEEFYKKYKNEQDQVYTLSRLFQLYRDKGMIEKATQIGETLISDYSAKTNLDKERYYLGEIYFKLNEPDKAQKVWKDLTKNSMWAELAQNKSTEQQWNNQTKNSMDRIPAMAR